MSSASPSQSRQPRSQRMASKRTDEVSFHGNVEFPFGNHTMQYEEEFSPTRQVQLDESFDSTRVSTKMRHDKRSGLSNTMRAWLGSQTPSVGGKPCIEITLEARLGPSNATIMSEWPSHPPKQRQAETPADRAPLDSVNQRLDDMLSKSFDPHIINYKPSKGFTVPKFMTYDGTSNPFDHIMHYRQLMTLDIGNDLLLCKVFTARLSCSSTASRRIL